MPNRQEHQQEVRAFLQKNLSIHNCAFSLPHGSGMETYFVQGSEPGYFVKVGASIERYLAMAGNRLDAVNSGFWTVGKRLINNGPALHYRANPIAKRLS